MLCITVQSSFCFWFSEGTCLAQALGMSVLMLAGCGGCDGHGVLAVRSITGVQLFRGLAAPPNVADRICHEKGEAGGLPQPRWTDDPTVIHVLR